MFQNYEFLNSLSGQNAAKFPILKDQAPFPKLCGKPLMVYSHSETNEDPAKKKKSHII
jgi:hypothetical protein